MAESNKKQRESTGYKSRTILVNQIMHSGVGKMLTELKHCTVNIIFYLSMNKVSLS